MRRISMAIVISLVAIMLLFLVSCEKREETTVVELTKDINLGVTSDTTKTTIERIDGSWSKSEKKIVTGRVEKIIFNRFSRDIIFFQDGVVIGGRGAEEFVWQIGKLHRIRMDGLSGRIEKVQVL